VSVWGRQQTPTRGLLYLTLAWVGVGFLLFIGSPVTAGPAPTSPIPAPVWGAPEASRAGAVTQVITADQARQGRAAAERYAADLGAKHSHLQGLLVTEVGPLSDETGVIGSAVVLRLPETRSIDALPQIDLRRAEGRYVSTQYSINVTGVRGFVALVDGRTNEVIGFSVRPENGQSPKASFDGPPPSVPSTPDADVVE
jgi:hypothetical protein